MSQPLGRIPSPSVPGHQPLSLLASPSLSHSLWQYLAFLAPSGFGCVNVSIPSQSSLLPADGELLGLMSHRSAPTWPGPVLYSLAGFTVVRCGGHKLLWTPGIGDPPGLRPRWRMGASLGRLPLTPTWGLGRAPDPAYPILPLWDLVLGVSLLSFLAVLRGEFLNRSECLLWVLGKITSLKCEDLKISTLLLLRLPRPPLSLLDTLRHMHTCAHTCLQETQLLPV